MNSMIRRASAVLLRRQRSKLTANATATTMKTTFSPRSLSVIPTSFSTYSKVINCSTISSISERKGYIVSGDDDFDVIRRRNFHSTTTRFGDGDYPTHTLLPFPALSPTMEMGTIAKWELAEGDSFSAGSVICSIETDKATMDFEAQDDGVLAKILKNGPDAVDLPIGSPIAIVVDEVDDVAAFANYKLPEGLGAGVPDAAGGSAPPAAAASSPAVTQPSVTGQRVPSIKFLGREGWANRLAGKPVTGTAAAPAPAATVAAVASAVQPTLPSIPATDLPLPSIDSFGSFEDVANNNMRKVIAKRLTESKRGVPHFYTSMEIELDNVMKLRKKLVADHDIKVSVNDVIIRCCSLALRDVPEVNGTYDPKTDTVKLQDTIDVSVAVATPTGLITPIVPNTDKMGLSEITEKIRDLAGRARDGKLAPNEYQGGTFCVSNLGMFGIDEFSAVINPPQAAILAVGGGTKRIVPTPYIDGAVEQPKPSIKNIMTARLSADRRVVDEATASLFMSAFKHYMTKPELLLL